MGLHSARRRWPGWGPGAAGTLAARGLWASGGSYRRRSPDSNHAPRDGRRPGIKTAGGWAVAGGAVGRAGLEDSPGLGGGTCWVRDVNFEPRESDGCLPLPLPPSLALHFPPSSLPFLSGLLPFPQPTPSGRQRDGEKNTCPMGTSHLSRALCWSPLPLFLKGSWRIWRFGLHHLRGLS